MSLRAEWRTIECAPRYEVSSLGDVRNTVTGKQLKPTRSGAGYRKVSLQLGGGKFVQKTVHRLVAETFMPDAYTGKQVNHIDGDKANNRLSNLEWVTKSENEQHSRYVLGNLCEPVVGIHKSGQCRLFASLAQAESELSLYRDRVRRCMSPTSDRRTAKGWMFVRYANIPHPAGAVQVDEAMVERACDAFTSHDAGDWLRNAMRAALNAALNPGGSRE